MKCYLTQEVAQKMYYYVHSVDAEISGIAKSEVKDGDIYITDILIRKQKCSGARTIIDEEDDMKSAFEMAKAGEDLSKWNVWWHSHNDMPVFWSSGVDVVTIKSLCSGGSFFVSIVTNKAGDLKTRLDIFPKDVSPFNIHSHYLVEDDIETIIMSPNFDIERKKELTNLLEKQKTIYDTQIKEIEIDIDKKIDELNEYKKSQIKQIEDKFHQDFGTLEEELIMIDKHVLEENNELKEKIDKEVALKVSVDIPIYNKQSEYKDYKENKEDNFEYTDLDFIGMSDVELLNHISELQEYNDENYSLIGHIDQEATMELLSAKEELEERKSGKQQEDTNLIFNYNL